MYDAFAYVYDEFMDNVPYEGWGRMLRSILAGHGVEDGLLLDLGCGTGKLTRLMAEMGFDMIGVDSSEDMLAVARGFGAEASGQDIEEGAEDTSVSDDINEYSNVSNEGILYLCQDMREFELYGTVRAVYSLCDCMNYLTDREELVKVFKLVNNYLDPEGIFIFDLNSIYKFSEVLGNRTFAENGDDASYIWENRYDEDTRINEYYLTLFIEDEDGRYVKENELHRQKGYTVDEVKEALTEAGLELLLLCDEDTRSVVTDTTERLLFVARESGKKK